MRHNICHSAFKSPFQSTRHASTLLGVASLGLALLGCPATLQPDSTPAHSAHPGAVGDQGFAQHEAPARYELGQPASAREIALVDIDVMPDGEGLPRGSGSVEEGRAVYDRRCLKCHGAEGRDGPFGSLVGRLPDDAFPFAENPTLPKTIGNYWPYATTIFDYVRRSMPQDQPGSLSDQDVYAVTAYLLHLNGLFPAAGSLDQDSLPLIQMPARDRFVPDNRRGGHEIR
ncbi:MAG: c-type cytochrome [Myxococcota bacterium]